MLCNNWPRCAVTRSHPRRRTGSYNRSPLVAVLSLLVLAALPGREAVEFALTGRDCAPAGAAGPNTTGAWMRTDLVSCDAGVPPELPSSFITSVVPMTLLVLLIMLMDAAGPSGLLLLSAFQPVPMLFSPAADCPAPLTDSNVSDSPPPITAALLPRLPNVPLGTPC